MSVHSGDDLRIPVTGASVDSDHAGVSAPSWRVQKTSGSNGSLDLPTKIEHLKAWSTTAMKCTKQAIEEKLGTTSPTRDPEIETKIDDIKRMQAKYQELLASIKKMLTHLNAVTTLEQSLSSQLTMVAVHQPELHSEFIQNAEVQRLVSASTSSYISALEMFCDGLETFCRKTVPDTLVTIRNLEHARLAYDAYRNDLARAESKAVGGEVKPPTVRESSGGGSAGVDAQPPTGTQAPSSQEPNIQQLRRKFDEQRSQYLALKADTDVKMKLLHENRTRVLRKHLQALQTATLSYYANTFNDLNSALRALAGNDKSIRHPGSENQPLPSFLEVESSVEQKSPQAMETDYALGEEQRDVFQD